MAFQMPEPPSWMLSTNTTHNSFAPGDEIPCKLRNIASMASLCSCHWLIRCNNTTGVIRVLLREVGLGTHAFEASVRVLAVVKGHAVHAQHVSLQVALLGGTVGAVTALEWSLAWREKQNKSIL